MVAAYRNRGAQPVRRHGGRCRAPTVQPSAGRASPPFPTSVRIVKPSKPNTGKPPLSALTLRMTDSWLEGGHVRITTASGETFDAVVYTHDAVTKSLALSESLEIVIASSFASAHFAQLSAT